MNYKRMIVILSVGLVFGFCFFFKELSRYEQIVYMNWGIDLPNASKEVYSVTEGGGSRGEGYRYHVFLYKSDKNIESLDWQVQRNLELERRIIDILSTLRVEQNYPSFECDYLSMSKEDEDGSELFVVYDPEEKKLYVVESFM